MTVAVTRNVSPRVRGFLASCMLQVGPGVYSAPRMSRAVRQRVEHVLRGWFAGEQNASVVLLWADGSLPEGQGLCVLGSPPYDLVEYDGMILSKLGSQKEKV